MEFRRKAFARAALRLLGLAAALLLAQIASAATVRAQQQTPAPRRPSGPAAGPIIRLPRGDGASLEQSQPNSSAKEQGERATVEPKRWEYCAITGFVVHQKGFSFSSPSYAPSAVVRFFPNTTEEVEGTNEIDALANAFTRLGDDGWELTGVSTNFSLSDGNGGSSSIYYFKRPKRPPQQQEQE
jgi:hypothetical protein